MAGMTNDEMRITKQAAQPRRAAQLSIFFVIRHPSFAIEKVSPPPAVGGYDVAPFALHHPRAPRIFAALFQIL
jgi:hypothetical protein